MPKPTTKKTDKPVTTAQKLGSVVKSARDIMRTDKGLNGELDRLPQLTWIMFLKLLDDSEKLLEADAKVAGMDYKPTIKPPYRWRDWAANEDFTSDKLKSFINNDEAVLPDGNKGEGLLAYLRNLKTKAGNKRADVIAKVFKDVNNRMISGTLLWDVLDKVNEIRFDKSEEVNVLSTLYESMLKEMRDAAGDSGEFYTPRPVVRFMVQVMNPQLGETIFDPACGTGGFLVEAYKYLKQNCSAQDWQILQKSLIGAEAKSLPLMLAHMSLLLHGFEYPDIDDGNSLRFTLSEMGEKDWVDVILTNPPFGGEEEDRIKNNFPKDRQTKETALLFLQLIMRRLRQRPKPGRAAVVFPNGVLFGDNMCAKIKEDLLKNFNLHTIVRLPNGVFAPYTSIPTNLLFFDRSRQTDEIWYYEIPLPEGRKSYTKTKPIQDEDFAECVAWWQNREENQNAWKYNFREVYHQARADAQPFWDAGNEAEERANNLAKNVKELTEKIKILENSILDFSPPKEVTKVKQQIQKIKDEVKQFQTEEQNQREFAKEQKAKGDAIYWAIYNLDRKNPNNQTDFEHLPPEQLVNDILEKDRRVAEIMSEIKAILG
ncbi:N-6 DNA methylase [Sphaerospermopsis torques-reginae]|uniref:site-specific DNA-methyltransferase (adenine-specific) n=1 Tax=Sphaerospermopsis torques-reginae ITEP-024 TaxID=984208 RepID=A0ABX8X0G2_9CYAN|nr:N-6 DNA methylase [Sphaerospermopsis torques-reginae]QYX32043.1 type I restriction-modification system subunit M [Sphaerospermopsis torques-reginae ITEP-024]